MSMSGHQSPRAKSMTWLTPPEWIKALGLFDLDPCCPPVMPWPTATRMVTEREDGLATHWEGRVWLNPPFGREWAAWVEKLSNHGNGIALIPARTETEDFYRLVWGRATAVCFVKGRPHFHREDGMRAPFNSGAPIALVAYGKRNAYALTRSELGVVVDTWLPAPRAIIRDDSGAELAYRCTGCNSGAVEGEAIPHAPECSFESLGVFAERREAAKQPPSHCHSEEK